MSARVLIVDDSSTMRLMLRRFLEKYGCQVIGEAENGKQAIEFYETRKPDLVTLDMIMPEQSGLQTLKQIRLMDKQAVVIMVSSLVSDDSLAACADLGATHYIVKPFTEEQIASVLERVLGPAAGAKPQARPAAGPVQQ